jgi:hypothetical protein
MYARDRIQIILLVKVRRNSLNEQYLVSPIRSSPPSANQSCNLNRFNSLRRCPNLTFEPLTNIDTKHEAFNNIMYPVAPRERCQAGR